MQNPSRLPNGRRLFTEVLPSPPSAREIPDHIGVTKENKSKGFVRTFIPLAGRKTFAAAVIDNKFDHPGLFNPVPVTIPFPFAGIGGALQNLDDLRCSLTPRSLQTPDMNCGDVMINTQPVHNRFVPLWITQLREM
jgi:hypothetical protein